jgi:hypothetical protein
MLGEFTARQTSAAYHVGEIYGRFEWLHGRRRSAASPSYEIGCGRGIAPIIGQPGDELSDTAADG